MGMNMNEMTEVEIVEKKKSMKKELGKNITKRQEKELKRTPDLRRKRSIRDLRQKFKKKKAASALLSVIYIGQRI